MKKCIICGTELAGSPLLTCENMPAAAQFMPSREQLESEKGIDLNLYQCMGCGLVQFDCEPVNYYRDVIRSGGFNTTMAELRREEYERFLNTCELRDKKILEVGCGQGEFLQILTEFPVKAYGVEHNYEFVEKAQSKGLNVFQGFAETSGTLFYNAPYDAFLSFNFLEHQPFPNEMMRCIYNNLKDGGYGLVTVPSFEYIFENDSFYELMRDHIAYYSEDTLSFLMEKNGFDVINTRRINRDTIEAIVQKRGKINISRLTENFKALKKQMQRFIKDRVESGRKVAIWGASHQSFTVISTLGLYDEIRYIIDSAPFKQGRYSPVSHIPIVSPDHFYEDAVDCILIIAPGYTNEIANIIIDKYGGNVEISALKSKEIEEYSNGDEKFFK